MTGGGGAGGQEVTPFIEIPTSRGEEETQTTAVDKLLQHLRHLSKHVLIH